MKNEKLDQFIHSAGLITKQVMYKGSLVLALLSISIGVEKPSPIQSLLDYSVPQSMVFELEESFEVTGSTRKAYEFSKVRGTFGDISLKFIKHIPAARFEELVLKSLPTEQLRARFKNYLPYTLAVSNVYGVDPFWVISVMWVESQFDTLATSYAGAMGLMQLMPNTAKDLLKFVKWDKSTQKHIWSLMYNPYHSIEMGVAYMKQLERMFDRDYRFATVAYNVGQGRARQLFTDAAEIEADNNYYLKVQAAYNIITTRMMRFAAQTPRTFQYTYVVKPGLMRVSDEDRLYSFSELNLPEPAKTPYTPVNASITYKLVRAENNKTLL